jgi:hypothetical protein
MQPTQCAALRRGLEDKDAGKAAAVAVSYVQLVYGRQLQQPADETAASDPLDVSQMTREERDALKRRILSQHPHLASRRERGLELEPAPATRARVKEALATGDGA